MNKNIIISIALLLIGLLGGYFIANQNSSSSESTANQTQNKPSESNEGTDTTKIKDAVSYALPSGFVEKTCDDKNIIYIVPSDQDFDCSTAPENTINVSIENEKITECDQLQERQEVKKHVCSSLYINDLRSLQSTTEYLESSSFKKETTSQEYYIDSGSGIVKVQYLYNDNGAFNEEFDTFVNSINAT